jgi:hypothetical protein
MGRMLDNNSTNINKTNNHLSPQTVGTQRKTTITKMEDSINIDSTPVIGVSL